MNGHTPVDPAGIGGRTMTNLTKFLHAMAEGVSEVAEQIDAEFGERGGSNKANTLRDYFSQLVAVAEVAEDGGGQIDWRELTDRVGIDLALEPEREPGGPAIVGGRLRLPDGDGYAWFDLESVKAALGESAEPAPVFVVEVPGREDETFLFAEHDAAKAFADALSPPSVPVGPNAEDMPISHGEGAEKLIAAERAALIEDMGMFAVAEDVREHRIALSTILIRLASIAETTEARGLVGHWIEVDEGRTIPEEARAFELIEADHIQKGDWIALDDAGAPGSEPRKVSRIQHRNGGSQRFAGNYVECEFEDTDPGASFTATEGTWRREC